MTSSLSSAGRPLTSDSNSIRSSGLSDRYASTNPEISLIRAGFSLSVTSSLRHSNFTFGLSLGAMSILAINAAATGLCFLVKSRQFNLFNWTTSYRNSITTLFGNSTLYTSGCCLRGESKENRQSGKLADRACREAWRNTGKIGDQMMVEPEPDFRRG